MSGLGLRFEKMSIRRLCGLLSLRRQRYYARRHHKAEIEKAAADGELLAQMQAVRKEHIAWGFKLIYHYLRHQKGLKFGKQRGHRLYQQAKMSLWRSPKKVSPKRVFQDLIAPQAPNQGWALDFVSEQVVGQQATWYRVLGVIDECSRKCLWLSAEQSMPASKVVEVLEYLVAMRGKPAYIRTDNGPEYVSDALKQWAQDNQVVQCFIQAGKPTQNGLMERMNGTLRRECLNIHWFASKQELDAYLEKWWRTYNFERPHSSLNFLTPVQVEKQFFSTSKMGA